MEDRELIAYFDRQFQELRNQLETEVRHLHVVVEQVHATVQTVAEGVATVDDKLERYRAEGREETAAVRALLRQSYTDLDRRVTVLEKRPRAL